MVASVDLTRYEPPLDYLLRRIDQLTKLIEQGVDLGFVREEATTVLQELSAFCRRRINFTALETRIREATSIDVGALEEGLDILVEAPRDELLSPEKLAQTFAGTREHFEFLKKEQHTMKFLEIGLRLEMLFESVFGDAILSIADGWDPAPIVKLARTKIDLLSEQRQREPQLLDVLDRATHLEVDDQREPNGFQCRSLTSGKTFKEGVEQDSCHALPRRNWLRPSIRCYATGTTAGVGFAGSRVVVSLPVASVSYSVASCNSGVFMSATIW